MIGHSVYAVSVSHLSLQKEFTRPFSAMLGFLLWPIFFWDPDIAFFQVLSVDKMFYMPCISVYGEVIPCGGLYYGCDTSVMEFVFGPIQSFPALPYAAICMPSPIPLQKLSY